MNTGRKKKIYAYIDKHSLLNVTRDYGWNVDLVKLKEYLNEKYSAEKVFLLIRYFERDKEIHRLLQKVGYVCLFIDHKEDEVKYMLDVVLQDTSFDNTIILTGNEDYSLLLDRLTALGKLKSIILPQETVPSKFVRYTDIIIHLGSLRNELEKGR